MIQLQQISFSLVIEDSQSSFSHKYIPIYPHLRLGNLPCRVFRLTIFFMNEDTFTHL